MGQLRLLIRGRYLVDAVGLNRVRGKPYPHLGDRGCGATDARTRRDRPMTDAVVPATTASPLPVLTRKDFVSDQEVRWCPGCGDYSILAQTQKVMPDFGYPKENIVFISGIGCSGRLPYYMNTYGFHSIHGRAPTLATGLKASRPDLMVWVITGDGDALSIGGNHVLHSMRRNVDIKLVMFNNRIYGLTKGQASPTSEFGKKTKSTPAGTIDMPIVPLSVAITAEATFVARSVDTHTEHLQETLDRGRLPQGLDVRRGPPELQHLQRRRVALVHRPRGPRRRDAGAQARRADDLRQGPRQGHPPATASRPRWSSWVSTASPRRTCWSTTRRPMTRRWRTSCRACGRPGSRCRWVSSGGSRGRPTTSWSRARSTTRRASGRGRPALAAVRRRDLAGILTSWALSRA